MRYTTRCLALGLSLAAFGVARPGRAQNREVEALTVRGFHLREQGQHEAALELFRQAWDISHAPRSRAQMALAEQALERWLDADAHLDEALQATTDPWIVRNRAALDGARQTIRQHLGTIALEGGVPGAVLRVNGAVAGTLPLANPVRVVAGRATVEVRADGYAVFSREVEVPGGGAVREAVVLARIAPVASPLPLPPVRAPGRTQRVVAWVAAGAAVLATGGGVTALVLREGEVETFNTDPRCVPTNGMTRQQVCADVRSRIDTLETLALVGFVSAGALAATSVVLFLTAPRGGEPARAGLACGAGPGELGIACGARF